MSEKTLFDIVDDIHSDIIKLKELFKTTCLEDPKISELANRFNSKLTKTERDLNTQARLCEYLPNIKKMKSAYRELYTRILFTLQQHRQSIYLLHMVYELISLREKVRNVEAFRRFINLTDKYVSLLAAELNMPTNLLIITTPQSEYAALPILSEGIFVVMLPLTNLNKPWKWVLLSHELGHLYYQYYKEKILIKVLPTLEDELRETIRDEKQVNDYVQLWGEYWLKEIVSDIIAAGLCGPAYLKMLITEASEPNPAQPYGSHPPLDARAIAQIKYIKLAGAHYELTSIMERVWKEFRNGVYGTVALPDFLNEDMVEHVSRTMVDFVRKPLIIEDWKEFKKVMDGLPATKDKDLKFVIPAMALSGLHVEL